VPSRLLQLYRVLAVVTGIGLAVLTFVGIPLQVFRHDQLVVRYVGIAHGWLFMAYVVVTLLLAYSRRWKPLKVALVVLAGTVPLAAFVAERRVVADERRAMSTVPAAS